MLPTREELAKRIWSKIEADLSDRGCFNDIDDDVMEELREAQVEIIKDGLR